MRRTPAVYVRNRTAFTSVVLALASIFVAAQQAQAHRVCRYKPDAPRCAHHRAPTPEPPPPAGDAPIAAPEEPAAPIAAPEEPAEQPEEPAAPIAAPEEPAEQPAPSAITSWRPPGSSPLSDSAAARQVTSRPENRPGNSNANQYSPSDEELEAFRNGQRDQHGRSAVDYNPLARYVTGGFRGTTDEILQWAAHKWGIPEDVVRAVAVGESWWKVSQLGDRRDGVNASAYPEGSRIDGDSVYQSLGLMQIKWTPDGLHTGTEPLRWKSTAFNVDYWAATVRYYFDGYCDWCAHYVAGGEWESIGAWNYPAPRREDMQPYISYIQGYLWNRTWESPEFN